ncbi:Gfo/Idh/MocA family protein [Burkholderia multivorans]|uniref:Gfo/Idh/MocA family protein n=1 Tax=Burkholderia multivorans TaxID=87883 RepID=UPI002ED1AE17|nr:Gfo/Idh/MocA family oxidoreductase [Burkholderia multivorans]
MENGDASCIGPKSPLRFGIVGGGYWAREIHAPVLVKHRDASLVGIWNRNFERAQEIAAALGVQAFESYEALVDSVDAVSFAIVPDAQPELASIAAQRGRHLLLEKPPALSLTAAQTLINPIVRGRVASVVFVSRRFDPALAQRIAAIAEKGNWDRADARFLSGALLPGTPYTGSGWRNEQGALWDLGPHALSVLLPVLGDVVGVEASREEPREIHVRLVHASGARSQFALGLHAEPSRQGESYVFCGADGAVERLDVQLRGALNRVAFGNAVEALVNAARTGRSHPCDAHYGLRMLRILAAAENSLESGNLVPIVEMVSR